MFVYQDDIPLSYRKRVAFCVTAKESIDEYVLR